MRLGRRFIGSDHGATSVEYALIIVAMSVILVAIFPTLSDAFQTLTGNIDFDPEIPVS